MKSMPGLNVKAALTQGGRAVRALDLQFGGLKFKSRSSLGSPEFNFSTTNVNS